MKSQKLWLLSYWEINISLNKSETSEYKTCSKCQNVCALCGFVQCVYARVFTVSGPISERQAKQAVRHRTNQPASVPAIGLQGNTASSARLSLSVLHSGDTSARAAEAAAVTTVTGAFSVVVQRYEVALEHLCGLPEHCCCHL